MKSRKKLGNREKKIKIKKSRKICQKKLFQNQEMFCYENCEKIFGIECFYNILHNSFIACARLVTVKP